MQLLNITSTSVYWFPSTRLGIRCYVMHFWILYRSGASRDKGCVSYPVVAVITSTSIYCFSSTRLRSWCYVMQFRILYKNGAAKDKGCLELFCWLHCFSSMGLRSWRYIVLESCVEVVLHGREDAGDNSFLSLISFPLVSSSQAGVGVV